MHLALIVQPPLTLLFPVSTVRTSLMTCRYVILVPYTCPQSSRYAAGCLSPPTHRQKHKAKAVPLHATQALEEGGNITPTHSQPRLWMGVSRQRHAPATL
jgi:hypothetical protein